MSDHGEKRTYDLWNARAQWTLNLLDGILKKFIRYFNINEILNVSMIFFCLGVMQSGEDDLYTGCPKKSEVLQSSLGNETIDILCNCVT